MLHINDVAKQWRAPVKATCARARGSDSSTIYGQISLPITVRVILELLCIQKRWVTYTGSLFTCNAYCYIPNRVKIFQQFYF
ncbi:hypothetical protein ANAPRD1_00405 [Anaplasma phagocytophilum]|nr:hypothetical protein ANAPRD1_00405 [Anaplasma phagocytophilum]SCV66391.1 hypothetical protein ANAPH2_01572 [Anaplasma phagocytophilum]